jgi:hypothetical protein
MMTLIATHFIAAPAGNAWARARFGLKRRRHGNRTLEQVKNSSGPIVWQLARSINALNRVAFETSALAQTFIASRWVADLSP